MVFIGFVIAFLLGYSILNLISTDFNIVEKLGFSFNIGVGFITFQMFLLNVVGIKITLAAVLIFSLVTIAGCLAFNYKKIKQILNPVIVWPKAGQINFAWMLLFGLMIYVAWAMYQKAIYWPVVEYDSVTGYDYMGKAIAHEGTFNNSLNIGIGYGENARFLYPPISSGSFAFVYLLGYGNSHIIMVVQFIFFLISIYALLLRFTNTFAAILITFFISITPEMLSHSALSLTNLENTIFVSIGIISLFVYFQSNEWKFLLLGSLFMGFNMWSRTDGIGFVGALGIILLYHAYINKKWNSVIVYGLLTIIPTFSWSLFIRFAVNAKMEALLILKPHWDSEKFFGIISYFDEYFWISDLYGPTFMFFILCICINLLINLYKKNIDIKKIYFLPIVLLSLLFYILIYYQIDYKANNLTVASLMTASFKRGLFAFVVLAWFYIGTNSLVLSFFKKLAKVLNLNHPN